MLCNRQERTELQVITPNNNINRNSFIDNKSNSFCHHFVFIVSLISVSVVLFQQPVQVEVIGNFDSEPLTSKTEVNGQPSQWVFNNMGLGRFTPGPFTDWYFLSLLLILSLWLGHLRRGPEEQSRREKTAVCSSRLCTVTRLAASYKSSVYVRM